LSTFAPGLPTGLVSRRTWGKITLGVLIIGGTLAVLWAAYQPSVTDTVPVTTPPKPPPLHHTHAVVLVQRAWTEQGERAEVSCDGRRHVASGFWAGRPGEACDALASTRGALLSGPGCRRTLRTRTRLRAVGAFGPRRFDHRAQHGGCPDPHGWLEVNALGAPVLPPERQLTDAPPH
jgi:hypothetical protein